MLNDFEAMNAAASEKKANPLENFGHDLTECWRLLPDKGIFFALLAAWIALFHFLGNSTFGYFDTPSLFGWMKFVFLSSPDDGHGILIPFVVLALFWWKRKTLLAAQKENWWPGLALVAIALVIHIVGYLVQQSRVSIVAFFVGLYGLMGLVWGRQFLRASFFPFFLFTFCLPFAAVVEPITFHLRVLVAKISAGIASVLGVGVTREGTQLFDAAHTFRYEVAAACSGIRSLIAILALATVYGFVGFRENWKRGILMVSALPLAIAANVVRMLAIILAAEMFGQEAGNYVHESTWLSLLPYVLAILGLMAIGRWLGQRKSDNVQTSETNAA